MVTVVDSIMGSGKTSWAIQYMNDNPEKSFLYITPFLKEIDRIIKSTTVEFIQPKNLGYGKLNSLNDLLSSGKNIAATHELFKYLNDESVELIKFNDYILILDEVLEVVTPINISKKDVNLLTENKIVNISDDGYVEWGENASSYTGRFEDIISLAKKRQLVCVNDTFLFWQYPPEVFTYFNSAYIMTYMFDASVLSKYFDVYDIPYSVKSIIKDDDKYIVSDYYEADKNKIRELIDIYDGKLNNYSRQKPSAYSKQWFLSSSVGKDIKELKNNLYNYFHHITKAKGSEIMWTTFKDYASKICSAGFIYRKDGINKTFVPCNARSTNEFGGKHYLAYCTNIYMNPLLVAFFNVRASKKNIILTIDQDRYALAQILQWIWRSAIRNGEKIHIYIPSKRMHDILKNWIEN